MSLKAVIFDMDGVLIDSEPLWRMAEISCAAKVGLLVTEEICDRTQGQKIIEVVAYWSELFPAVKIDHQQLAQEIIDKVIALVLEQGKCMPGVANAIAACQSNQLPMAIASSSSMSIIDAVVDKLGIREHFSVIHSAEKEQNGKPAPDVYLTAATKLGVEAKNCLAIEDSYSGVQSAQCAGMEVVAVHCTKTVARLAGKKLHDLSSLQYVLASNSGYILETNRLLLREFTLDDAGFLFTLLNDPGWLKNIGDRNIHVKEDAREFLRDKLMKSYSDDGFGFYMVLRKDKNTPIGMSGIVKRDCLDFPDIGFAFLEEYCGHGFATESAKAVLLYAKNLGLDHIVAITSMENKKSAHVLEKIGLRYDSVKNIDGYDGPNKYFVSV